MKIRSDEDIEDIISRDELIAIIGYGSQGKSQALNIRDEGYECLIGLREGSVSKNPAEEDGFEVVSIFEAVRMADIIALLIPDERQTDLYEEVIGKEIGEGTLLIFGSGYAITFEGLTVNTDIDVGLVSPMAPGILLRKRFTEGDGVPCKVAVHNDYTGRALDRILHYAKLIGCGRRGCLLTDFRVEAELDLFSEQAVLCGGLPALMKSAYRLLIEEGYPEELAYIETVQEVKLIADLIAEFGISGMWERVSSTALYGGLSRGERVLGDDITGRMRDILSEIQDGTFAEEMKDMKKVSRGELAEDYEKFEDIEERLRGLFHKKRE